MTKDQTFIAQMDKINKTRALTEAEVDQLVEAIARDKAREHRQGSKARLKPHWTEQEAATVLAAIRSGSTYAAAGKLVERSAAAVRHHLGGSRRRGRAPQMEARA